MEAIKKPIHYPIIDMRSKGKNQAVENKWTEFSIGLINEKFTNFNKSNENDDMYSNFLKNFSLSLPIKQKKKTIKEDNPMRALLRKSLKIDEEESDEGSIIF